MILRILLMAVMIYAALTIILFLAQSRLVFLPYMAGRDLVATPEHIGLAFREVEIRTEDNEVLHGWWVPHAEPRATLLFSHGNAGNISHRLDSLRIFHDLGLNVLIYDYRGYGQSSGRPSEAGVYRDAEAAWHWLVDEQGIGPGRIVLFGRSMGGAIAARLATQVNAGALIVESSFTSVPDIGAEVYWWLPVRWLARIRFPTIKYVANTTSPVLVVHSTEDEIIPFSHGRRLHEAAPGPKRLLELAGDHNTGFLASGQIYRQGLDEFLRTFLDES